MDLLQSLLSYADIKTYLSQHPPEQWEATIAKTLLYGIHSLKALGHAGLQPLVPSSNINGKAPAKRSSRPQSRDGPRSLTPSSSRRPASKKAAVRKVPAEVKENMQPEALIAEFRLKTPTDVQSTASDASRSYKQSRLENYQDIPRVLQPVELPLRTDATRHPQLLNLDRC